MEPPPLEWQRDSEMSQVINGLSRHVFTWASEGISSLSIHCGVTPRSQKWINQSSALRSLPPPSPHRHPSTPRPPKTCQLSPCSAAGNQGVASTGKHVFVLFLASSAKNVFFVIFSRQDYIFDTDRRLNFDSCLVSAA